MTELIAVIFITILAVISPGADFVVVTKYSYIYGRKTGIYTSVGIALGVLVHVCYTILALTFVIAYTPYILNIVKYIGAIYLIYLGFKTFNQKPITETTLTTLIKPLIALKNGFLTNALNPKTMLFVISTYTQIVNLMTSKTILFGYGLFMSFAHFFWFGSMAILFSSVVLRQKMLKKQIVINRVIGAILCSLGIALLFTNFQSFDL